MVNENINKIIYESLRLIRYDRFKTLSEQSDATFVDNSLERSLPQMLRPDRYPNYCKYPDKAVNPPNIGEQSGLITTDEGVKYCYYPVPTTQGGGTIGGMHIPADATLSFWGDLEDYNRVINEHMKDYPNDNLEIFQEMITDIFPPGTVGGIGNDTNGFIYKPVITRLNSEGTLGWKFKGFYNKNGKPYIQPKWEDPRNDYQKFVDDWGFILQMTAVVATAIAGALSGGAGWVLTAEILVELGLGTMVGLRELEKGNNVAATMSFITGGLPMLKLSPAFRGVSAATLETLSSKIAESGLSKSSSVRDYLKFYRTLAEEEQKVLTKILRQDEVSRNAMLKLIGDGIDQDIVKMVMNSVEKNPRILTQLNFWDKLWARELTSNAVVGVLGITTQLLFGKELNDEEKAKITSIYQNIPKEHTKEFIYNLAQNGDKITQILDNISKDTSANSIISGVSNKVGSNMSKWFNTRLKKHIEDAGGTYTELPDDPTTAVPNQQGSGKDGDTKRKDERSLRKDGYIPEEELNGREPDYTTFKLLNGKYWYKID